MSAPPPSEDVEKVARVWGDADFTRNLAEIHWMASPVVRGYLNRLASGSERVDWLTDLSARYLRPRKRRVLVLGCGEGWLERSIAPDPLIDRIDAYDIAPEAVARAEEHARAAGITKIRYGVLDLNRDSLPREAYELVIAHSVLHHVENLEHALPEIANALVPDGVMFVNEYVGPMRFQYTDDQMAVINDLLARLPDRLRRAALSDGIYPHKTRPTIEEMIRTDPSEAVRSDEILPLLDRHFDVKESILYGGTVLNHLLYDIVQNFGEAPPDRTMMELLCLVEELLIEHGGLASDYQLAVATRRDAPPGTVHAEPRRRPAANPHRSPGPLLRAAALAGGRIAGLRSRRREVDLRGTEHPAVARYLNANAASPDGAASWHEVILRDLQRYERARVLVLGERVGEWSRWFLERPECARVDVALAPRGHGLDVMRRDFAELPPAGYDLVVSIGALSMLPRSADGVAAVARSLEPGGVLFAEEYLGLPLRELRPATAEVLRRVLAVVPGDPAIPLKRKLKRLAARIATGGSFGAGDLRGALSRTFEDLTIRPYTSLLLQEVIAARPELLATRGDDAGVLELICGLEKWLMTFGVIEPDFVMIRARRS